MGALSKEFKSRINLTTLEKPVSPSVGTYTSTSECSFMNFFCEGKSIGKLGPPQTVTTFGFVFLHILKISELTL